MTETETGKRETTENGAAKADESETKKQKLEEESKPEENGTDKTPADKKTEENGDDKVDLATAFPSLKASLLSADTPILALYFASAWCSDCQESAPHVTKIFDSQKDDDKIFDLIYVSSDKDAKEMQGNVNKEWGSVPFENEEERSNLKRHFGACASKEVEGLGIKPEDKKSGIPTLLLLEKKTGKMLTQDAISDIMGDKKLEDPLATWKSLLFAS
jgi:nucleoredoxin